MRGIDVVFSTANTSASVFRAARFALVAVTVLTIAIVVAPREAHAQTRLATSPSIDECLYFKPRLHKGVQKQAGCVAALQIFLSYANNNPDVARDGRLGPKPNVTSYGFKHHKGSMRMAS